MQRETIPTTRQFLIDLFSISVILCFNFGLMFFANPYKRGFFCEDNSIRFPSKPSTVDWPNACAFGFVINIHVMLITEFIIHTRNRNDSTRRPRSFSWLWRVYNSTQIFFFGSSCCLCLTNFMKYITGRLRPHFLHVCQPNVNCSSPEKRYKYIEDFDCSGTQVDVELRLSFPSGHAAFTFYSMVYLVIYLQKNFTWEGSKLFKPLCQFICILIATGISLSRVSDHQHHWSDVLAGTILGILSAVLTTYFISDLFEKKPSSEASSSTRRRRHITIAQAILPDATEIIFIS